MSNRGDNLSSSDVMLASGDKDEAGVDGAVVAKVLDCRLLMEP